MDNLFSIFRKRQGETIFSRLSEEAQQLIVSATLGEFDSPPDMSDNVREEILQWASGENEKNND